MWTAPWKSCVHWRSIYGQIVLLLLSLFIVLFLFMAWVISSLSNNYLETVTTRCGNRVAGLINQTISNTMISGDHDDIPPAINRIQTIPGVSAIRVYDDRGNMKYHTPLSETEPSLITCTNCHGDTRLFEKQTESIFIHPAADEIGRAMILRVPILAQAACQGAGCHQTQTPNAILGHTEIILPLESMDNTLQHMLLEYFLIVIAALILLITVLLVFVHYRINVPLRRIVEVSGAFSSGDTSIRVELKPRDLLDVQQVGNAINHMLDSIDESKRELERWSLELENKVRSKSEDFARTQNEIYQIERLASLGRLSSSVAHEINNPLAGVLTYAKLSARILQGPELTDERKAKIIEHLQMIQSETTRCGEIVKGLLNFSREGDSTFEVLHLNPLLQQTSRLIRHSLAIADITLHLDLAAHEDRINGNANQIKQVCLAVLTNAMEAVEGDSNGTISLRSYNPDASHVVVEIHDNGVGIAPEDQQHIFEPFFSRKQDLSGIGLGLAVSYGIMERHQARIEVDSALGVGTSMKFIFKLVEKGSSDG